MSGPGVLLDRDGTIIADHGYVGSVDRVEFLDGAIEAIAALNRAKIPVAVVTNQAGVVGALGRTRELPRPPVRPRRFPDAGLVILRSRPGDGPEIWCRCDGGPHGFLSIAAHAHADALSVELRHDGVDILTDPGTYCYHGEPRWRDWFRSTAAHNTVEVNGVSQAESGGPFLWITQPRTRTITCDVGEQSVQTWRAEHDGYRRLDTPTAHRRAVTLDSPGRVLTVVDTFETGGDVSLRLWWHLGPQVMAELDGSHAALSWPVGADRHHGTLELPDGLAWTAHTAEVDPVAGWYSPRFGGRVPATSLEGRGLGSSSTRLVTAFTLP